MKKDETSLGLISCKAWRGKLQPVFTGNLGYKLCLKHSSTQGQGSGISLSHQRLPLILQLTPSWCLQALVLDPPMTNHRRHEKQKDNKAQENATSDNVQISAPILPSLTSYLKFCKSKELQGSVPVSIILNTGFNLYRSVVDLQHCINISCMGN